MPTLCRFVMIATERYQVIIIKSAIIVDLKRYDMMHRQVCAVDNACRQAYPAAVTVTLKYFIGFSAPYLAVAKPVGFAVPYLLCIFYPGCAFSGLVNLATS
jgi:hypothetical protein